MEPQPISTAKTIAIVAIVVGCFAILFPRFLHPMFNKMIGNSPSGEDSAKDPDVLPPNLRQSPRGGSHDSRAGFAHPGLRATPEMRVQQPSAPSRGMIGVVLPMYAIGIVLYLIWTLFKVFSRNNKDDKHAWRKENNKYGYRDRTYNYHGDSRDSRNRRYNQSGSRRHSEDEMDMATLQQRLVETEAQMSRILDAMKLLSGRVEDLDVVTHDLGDQILKDNEDILPGVDDQAVDHTNDIKNNDIKTDKSTVCDAPVRTLPYSSANKDIKVETLESAATRDEVWSEIGDNHANIDRGVTDDDTDQDRVFGDYSQESSESDHSDSGRDVLEELRNCSDRMTQMEKEIHRAEVKNEIRRRRLSSD